MSDAQIWVFGILAFIVLLALVSRISRRRGVPWPVAHHQDQQQYEMLAQTSLDTQQELRQDVAKLRDEATEIKMRLESIEQLLKSVD
ncbi:hypothetical protein ABN034_17320 [Actinopolymorpha sp. B11F2]|uniref:hypothetical protein n=1 Tax=Actinopolymorpha sp. B11F2 TaxID=3160862 RepID=UPI0032E42274